MRISDWSSDVCSSDLGVRRGRRVGDRRLLLYRDRQDDVLRRRGRDGDPARRIADRGCGDRSQRAVAVGRRLSVHPDAGGGRGGCGLGAALIAPIERTAQTGSTNADLLARLAGGEAVGEGDWLIADRQTSGRGRLGRAWGEIGRAAGRGRVWTYV